MSDLEKLAYLLNKRWQLSSICTNTDVIYYQLSKFEHQTITYYILSDCIEFAYQIQSGNTEYER